ncbi:hypothetical protein KSP40_PGU004197 [Platanthera guangdongensis]|uniref:dihydroorotase n=1 Tax=Platanthera guangdongensis TaxID=2320717 RepID=A0ABR2N1A4_9ASPA
MQSAGAVRFRLPSGVPKYETPTERAIFTPKMELRITKPDDWHLHLRDGDLLEAVLPHSARHFGRAIVMPNLKPPITTTAAALTYRDSILKALPPDCCFHPLMTLYLTDDTDPDEIKLARRSGVVYAVKFYPAGATTNSQDGVTDIFGKCFPVLEQMVEHNMPLLVHGEVVDPNVDIFDREKVFIERILEPLVQKLPHLKVVMEHITTMDAVKFIMSSREGYVAATVTPQHLVLNRNALFHGGLQPHSYCLPVLKREVHSRLNSASKFDAACGHRNGLHGGDVETGDGGGMRAGQRMWPQEGRYGLRQCSQSGSCSEDCESDDIDCRCCKGRKAIASAVTSGSKRFFLGTDSAPHERNRKECSAGCAGIFNASTALSLYARVFEEAGALDKLEAFTSFNGPDFYGLERNTSKILLEKTPWRVPRSYLFASGELIPMCAGQMLDWLPSHFFSDENLSSC